jgi:Predicted metalloprotease
VLFTDVIQSGCGFARGATGPFYCPQDRQVYIDLGFSVNSRNGWVQAAISQRPTLFAHEVGHHVQKLLGITDRVDAARRRASEAESNRLSVRSSCRQIFSPAFGRVTPTGVKHVVEAGDIEEAIRAANAVGDDRLNPGRAVTSYPIHLLTARRNNASAGFRRGYETGDVSQGDTFNAREL